MARRRRRIEHGVVAALVVVVLAAVALLGFVGGDDDQDRSEPATDTPPAAAETPSTTAAATTDGDPVGEIPVPAPAPPAEPDPGHDEAPAVLADGRYPAYLTRVDAAGRTLELDLVQWLEDDDAVAYVEAHPDEFPGMFETIEELGGYPHDQLVVNDNPRLRTLPVVDDPQVVVLRTAESDHAFATIDYDDLAGYFDRFPASDSPERLSNNVFWLSVEDGRITTIEEQFQA